MHACTYLNGFFFFFFLSFFIFLGLFSTLSRALQLPQYVYFLFVFFFFWFFFLFFCLFVWIFLFCFSFFLFFRFPSPFLPFSSFLLTHVPLPPLRAHVSYPISHISFSSFRFWYLELKTGLVFYPFGVCVCVCVFSPSGYVFFLACTLYSLFHATSSCHHCAFRHFCLCVCVCV